MALSQTMRCIFCKSVSSSSRSVEHIVPESLGNTSNILPPGIVCDQCNNYFSRKLEKPVLDSGLFTVARFMQALPNKRGRVPIIDAIIEPGGPVEMVREPDGKTHVRVPSSIFEQLATSETGRLILPVTGSEPESYVFSRFLAKIALEAMAQRLLIQPESLAKLIDDPQFDLIRDYARRGNSKKTWPYHKRQVYEANHRHTAQDGTTFQVLYEYDFLLTRRNELYFALILLGIEYVINVVGPDIDGYEEWLQENQDRSPLYSLKKH